MKRDVTKHVCKQTAYSWVILGQCMHEHQLEVNLAFHCRDNTHPQFTWVKRVIEGRGARSKWLQPPHAPVQGWELLRQKEQPRRGSHVKVQKWRGKRSRRWIACRWGCVRMKIDLLQHWWVAACQETVGALQALCCGTIKRNRGPPSCYNCCRDLSKGSMSLYRNLCNPRLWVPHVLFPISMSRCCR